MKKREFEKMKEEIKWNGIFVLFIIVILTTLIAFVYDNIFYKIAYAILAIIILFLELLLLSIKTGGITHKRLETIKEWCSDEIRIKIAIAFAFMIIAILLSGLALYLFITCIHNGILVQEKNFYWSLGIAFASVFMFFKGRSFFYKLKTYEKFMQYGSFIFTVIFVIMVLSK